MAEAGPLSTFYVSHGSPMMPLQDIPVRDFFVNWTKRYPTRYNNMPLFSFSHAEYMKACIECTCQTWGFEEVGDSAVPSKIVCTHRTLFSHTLWSHTLCSHILCMSTIACTCDSRISTCFELMYISCVKCDRKELGSVDLVHALVEKILIEVVRVNFSDVLTLWKFEVFFSIMSQYLRKFHKV